jgi:hypothetical protein
MVDMDAGLAEVWTTTRLPAQLELINVTWIRSPSDFRCLSSVVTWSKRAGKCK